MFSWIANNPFLFPALFAGLAASITGGVIGSYVALRQILFIAGSISHSVLGGIGFFLWLKRTYHLEYLSLLSGALFAGILSALVIGYVRIYHKERMDTIISLIWSTGMALGVIFLSMTPGYNVELSDFLFGNIMWVSTQEIKTLFILDGILLVITVLMHKRFLAICFDEEHARLQKVAANTWYLLLLCLVAVSIVILLQVVGAILVIAMLTIPAAIASTFSSRLSRIMWLAVIFGAIFTTTGIFISYEIGWPPGATIALVSTAFYAARLALPKKPKKELFSF